MVKKHEEIFCGCRNNISQDTGGSLDWHQWIHGKSFPTCFKELPSLTSVCVTSGNLLINSHHPIAAMEGKTSAIKSSWCIQHHCSNVALSSSESIGEDQIGKLCEITKSLHSAWIKSGWEMSSLLTIKKIEPAFKHLCEGGIMCYSESKLPVHQWGILIRRLSLWM